MATGCLSDAQVPDIKGLESFAGKWYHTGKWPHEGVDFTGRRVGVIGTGSSAIQSIPLIAKQASHLYVFQRTPNFSMPAQNAPLDPEYERRVKEGYADFRRQARESRVGFVTERSGDSALAVPAEEREREYEKRWRRGGLGFSAAYTDLLISKEANDTAARFFREKIRAIVRDPAVADLLCPQSYPLGTKRLCVDTGYYDTFNRDNVTLVDVRKTPIEAITPKGVRVDGVEYAVDDLVFATGFDAMTGALLNIDIRGRGGRKLGAEWAGGPRTYLGLTVEGFPNLFMITGPGSPSVLSNMIVSIEQHVDWIADCVSHLRERGLAHHRGDGGGPGGVGPARQRGGPHDALPARAVLVHGREHPGQAARVHALHRRRRRLPPEVRRGRGEGLRGLRAGRGEARRASSRRRRWRRARCGARPCRC